MPNQLITNYTFTPASKTIQFLDLLALDRKRILGITNSTQNRVIYNPNSAGLGGTVSGNTLTLTFDTTIGGYSATDDLIIIYKSGQSQKKTLASAISEVSYVTVTNSGTTAYGTGATIAFTGGTGTNATATAIFDSAGFLVGIRILTVGSYTVAPTGVTITANSTGAGATATVTTGVSNRIALSGEATVNVQLYGAWVGTVTFEASIDGQNWVSINGNAQSNGSISSSNTTNNNMFFDVSGYDYFQVRCSAYTSGRIAVLMQSSYSTSLISLDAQLPTGANTIGNIGTLTTLSQFNSASAAGDGFANQTTTSIHGLPKNYNGATWDFQRANTNSNIVSTATAITATTASADQINYNGKGVIITSNITVVSGTTPTYALSIQAKDNLGNYVTVAIWTGNLTATGLYSFSVYPGIATVTTGNSQSVSTVLPRFFRVVETIAGTTPSFTRTLTASFIV
jgi:hypothetical protein